MRIPEKQELLNRLTIHRRWLDEQQADARQADLERQQRLHIIQDIRRQLHQYYGE